MTEVTKEQLSKATNEGVTIDNLARVLEVLEPLKDFTTENISKAVNPLAKEYGNGSIWHPFRIALTGRDNSPSAPQVASILGKDKTIKRIEKAMEKLNPYTNWGIEEFKRPYDK